MPLYVKTSSGWKLAILGWEKRASGWVFINPLSVKTLSGGWERLLPWGEMLAPAVTSPANGTVIKTGTAVGVTLTAIASTNFQDEGAGTQIQIARDAGFANPVANYEGAYVTSHAFQALGAGTYYIRGRHCGRYLGWGPWSTVTALVVVQAIGTLWFTASQQYVVPYDGWFNMSVVGGGGGGGGLPDDDFDRYGYGGGAGGDSRVRSLSGSACDVWASGGAGGGGMADYMSGDHSRGEGGASSSSYGGGAGVSIKLREEGHYEYDPNGGDWNGGDWNDGSPSGADIWVTDKVYGYYCDGNPAPGGGEGLSPYGMGGMGGKSWYGPESKYRKQLLHRDFNCTESIQRGQNCPWNAGGNGMKSTARVYLARGTVLQISIGSGGSGGGGTGGATHGMDGSAGAVCMQDA